MYICIYVCVYIYIYIYTYTTSRRKKQLWRKFVITLAWGYTRNSEIRECGSNRGPSDLQSDTLPTELSRLVISS